MGELVSKGNPVSFYQHLEDRRKSQIKKGDVLRGTDVQCFVYYHEAFDGSVEGVQQDTGYSAGLGCPVPAV